MEIVDRQEAVDVGQGRLEPARQRLVAGPSEQRIEPDQAMRGALEARRFSPDEFGIATVLAIADQEHNRAMAEDAPAPAKVEIFERFADASPNTPIMYMAHHLVDCFVDVTVA